MGYRKIPVLIQPMSYEDAVVKMVDTNLHREHISFSEKAFAYRMKNEALKQKVGRKKGQSGQQKKGKKTIELIGEEFGDSPKQVQRYIAVTRLIPELLQKLDQGEISFNPAVEISALTKEEVIRMLMILILVNIFSTMIMRHSKLGLFNLMQTALWIMSR